MTLRKKFNGIIHSTKRFRIAGLAGLLLPGSAGVRGSNQLCSFNGYLGGITNQHVVP